MAVQSLLSRTSGVRLAVQAVVRQAVAVEMTYCCEANVGRSRLVAWNRYAFYGVLGGRL